RDLVGAVQPKPTRRSIGSQQAELLVQAESTHGLAGLPREIADLHPLRSTRHWAGSESFPYVRVRAAAGVCPWCQPLSTESRGAKSGSPLRLVGRPLALNLTLT